MTPARFGRTSWARGCGRRARNYFTVVASTERVWTLTDEGGLVAFAGHSGRMSVPFWESEQQAEAMRAQLSATHPTRVFEVSSQAWLAELLPALESRGWSAGISWAGPDAQGFDIDPDEAAAALLARVRGRRSCPPLGFRRHVAASWVGCAPFGW